MIKVCRNGDIRAIIIHVKKTGNTCPYIINVNYSPGIVFDSMVSPYGSYSGGVINIPSLVHGMEFDIVLNVRITDISQINFTVTPTAVSVPGCDTIINNNGGPVSFQKGTAEECINSCEDVTSEACTHDIQYKACESLYTITRTLPRCFQCDNGFTNEYIETGRENVLSWSIDPVTRVINIIPYSLSSNWFLTLEVTCNKDTCTYGPYGPFTLAGVAMATQGLSAFTDGEGTLLGCDCIDLTKLLVSFGEEEAYVQYDTIEELEEAYSAFWDSSVCWNSSLCVFTIAGENSPHSILTKLLIPLVDTDGDCPDYCDGGTLDFTKFQKIDLTPYGGGVVSVADASDIVDAFAALDTPLTVTVVGCAVALADWVCGQEYAPIEVIHTTASVYVYLEDGVGTNLTYTNINTTVGFLGMSYDLSAYGGDTHELHATGLALANRMIELTGQAGWVWLDNSGGNVSRLHNPSLTTAITVTDIPTQRRLQLIDTNEGIAGSGINNQENGNVGATIDYTVFTSVNFTPVGGSVTAVQDDGDIISTLAGLGKTAVILLADIHIENWAIATGYGNLEVSFLYDCWEVASECPDGDLTNINVDGVDYSFGATSYTLLPSLLLSIGIPGLVAANWDAVEDTITISFRHGMGGTNVDLTESCDVGTPLELVKISSAQTSSCVTI